MAIAEGKVFTMGDNVSIQLFTLTDVDKCDEPSIRGRK